MSQESLPISVGLEGEHHQPINCDLYDQLVLWAMRRKQSQIWYRDAQGNLHQVEAKILDLISRAGQEWLILEPAQEIRLDALIRVNHMNFQQDM